MSNMREQNQVLAAGLYPKRTPCSCGKKAHGEIKLIDLERLWEPGENSCCTILGDLITGAKRYRIVTP